MRPRSSSESESADGKSSLTDRINNIRLKPAHIFDNITRKLLQLGITLAITTFIGLIVRYLVQEFDPNAGQIVSVSTSRVGNRDFASFSVSRNFLERFLEFIEESLSIVANVIPLGFPLCTLFNRYLARIRAGEKRMSIEDERVLCMIPKYVVIGDSSACQAANSSRLRPLVRDSIYHMIRAHLKPKLIVEDSYDDARKLGMRIGLLRRNHHRLAVIKSVDLLKNITDSRGDIKQAKVRYLLSRLKVLSQSTPADKSFLIYLMKHCESQPNERLVYLGYSFTDPEAMRLADCALTFADCDDDDVKKAAQVQLRSPNQTFTDVYLFLVVSLLYSNIVQSYALYQISASVSSCLYRFLTITVFQEQLISHSQFMLVTLVNQVFAILALMTKWLSSLPKTPLRPNSVAEMSHAVTEDSILAQGGPPSELETSRQASRRAHKSRSSNSLALHHEQHRAWPADQTSELSSSEDEDREPEAQARGKFGKGGDERETSAELNSSSQNETNHHTELQLADQHESRPGLNATKSRSSSRSRSRSRSSRRKREAAPIHLSGVDLDQGVIDSKLVTSYKQTFHNSQLIDDVTYRLAKLHIAYQVLVMVIIMIFGHSMFHLDPNNSRQQQTLALNSLVMNNIFNLTNCFNQFGAFDLRSGVKNHPFFLCLLIMAIFVQVSLTELNAFGLENLNPIQWFVCFVFAALSALIAPLTGQQQQRPHPQQPAIGSNLEAHISGANKEANRHK